MINMKGKTAIIINAKSVSFTGIYDMLKSNGLINASDSPEHNLIATVTRILGTMLKNSMSLNLLIKCMTRSGR